MEALHSAFRENRLKVSKPERVDIMYINRQHGHLVMKSILSFVDIGQMIHTLKKVTKVYYLSLKKESRPGSRVQCLLLDTP